MAALLAGYEVTHVVREGWDSLSNGRLLAAAEEAGFQTFVTADRNLRHQQNLAGRSLAVLVLDTNYWPAIRRDIARVADALNSLRPGDVVELNITRSR